MTEAHISTATIMQCTEIGKYAFENDVHIRGAKESWRLH